MCMAVVIFFKNTTHPFKIDPLNYKAMNNGLDWIRLCIEPGCTLQPTQLLFNLQNGGDFPVTHSLDSKFNWLKKIIIGGTIAIMVNGESSLGGEVHWKF